MADTVYTEDLTFFAITPAQAESLLDILEQAAVDTNFYVNTKKT